MMKRTILALLTCMLIGACSSGADTTVAEEGVVAFHTAFNDAHFDAIYKTSDPEYKVGSAQADSTKFLGAVRNKLGRFRSGKTVGWNDQVGPGGHYVTLTREAQFDRGRGQETFVFKIANRNLALVGYNINSNDLITR